MVWYGMVWHGPVAAHLAGGEGRRGTLARSIFIHFARGEGLEGGRGDPPIGPHTPSISRRGRVAGGEGPPYPCVPPPVTASHRRTRTAPHITAHHHKSHRLPPHLTSSQPSWLPSSGLSSHSYSPARAAADFSTARAAAAATAARILSMRFCAPELEPPEPAVPLAGAFFFPGLISFHSAAIFRSYPRRGS